MELSGRIRYEMRNGKERSLSLVCIRKSGLNLSSSAYKLVGDEWEVYRKGKKGGVKRRSGWLDGRVSVHLGSCP